jgi:hypothetical protein
MIELQENHFVALSEFRLAWRFNDPNYHVLPSEALADLRPLDASCAASINLSVTAASTVHQSGPSEPIARIDAAGSSDQAVKAASAELAALPIAGAQRVIVSWDQDHALETSWLTFRSYWNDFCYPSSDDVTIVPLEGGWTLRYHHWEQFSYVGAA